MFFERSSVTFAVQVLPDLRSDCVRIASGFCSKHVGKPSRGRVFIVAKPSPMNA
jgi:hypothetical protein